MIEKWTSSFNLDFTSEAEWQQEDFCGPAKPALHDRDNASDLHISKNLNTFEWFEHGNLGQRQQTPSMLAPSNTGLQETC